MAAKRFVEVLNAQIGSEFSAHNRYVACAAYYDGLTMPQMAGLFYRQALEERAHAMMMVQYLIDCDEPVVVPGVDSPSNDFSSEQFMQWFIKEQVEEVSSMSDLLTVVTRSKNDIEGIEDFVARETGKARADPTAPAQAGANA